MTMIAEFASTCPYCEGRVHAGELITVGPDGWGHAACPEPRSSSTPTCPDCFIQHRGECL